MTEPTRRLSAVFFADIVGYTALTAKDEALALRLVAIFQRLARKSVEQMYQGRVVKFIGDAALAEFTSTDAAVRAALMLQREYAYEARAQGTTPYLRTAVHLGEVIASPDGDIYGDGVNTASRLQREAQPGQIIVSEDVWRQLRTRREFRFHSLGELELRGIAARVPVFDVDMEDPLSREEAGTLTVARQKGGATMAAARAGARKYAGLLATLILALAAAGVAYQQGWVGGGGSVALSGQPAVAVLPFEQRTGSNGQYADFAEGLVEAIESELLSRQKIALVGSSSVGQYAASGEPIIAAARQLGFNAVLAGSARWSGSRVRVAAQLTDPHTSRSLWSDTYEREVQDAFATQRELARLIAVAIEDKLVVKQPEPAPKVAMPVVAQDTARAGARPVSQPPARQATPVRVEPAAPAPRLTQAPPQRQPAPTPAQQPPRRETTPVAAAQPSQQKAAQPVAPAPQRQQPQQMQPQPQRPQPQPAQPQPATPVAAKPDSAPAAALPFDPITERPRAEAELRRTLAAFANALKYDNAARVKALYPTASAADLAALNEHRAGATNVEPASIQVRRMEPRGAEANFLMVFTSPAWSRPIPYRVRFALQTEGWRIQSLTAR